MFINIVCSGVWSLWKFPATRRQPPATRWQLPSRFRQPPATRRQQRPPAGSEQGIHNCTSQKIYCTQLYFAKNILQNVSKWWQTYSKWLQKCLKIMPKWLHIYIYQIDAKMMAEWWPNDGQTMARSCPYYIKIMPITHDDHIWRAYMMIIYDDHIWWSYLMIIHDDHIWW